MCSESTADWLPAVMALRKKDVEPNPTASVTTSLVTVGLVELTKIAANLFKSDLFLFSVCVLTIFHYNYYPSVILFRCAFFHKFLSQQLFCIYYQCSWILYENSVVTFLCV